MNKNLLIIFIMFLSSTFSYTKDSTYVQYEYELSNINGVPFSIVMEYHCLWGFDVDDSGDFWFFGGDTATLVHASSKGKFLNRKKVLGVYATAINVKEKHIFFFDRRKNDLYSYDVSSLEEDNVYKNVTSENVNSYTFEKDGIILEIVDAKPPYDVNEMFKYKLYSFDGNYIKELGNRNDLPKIFDKTNYDNYSKIFDKRNYHYYLGKYNELYLFTMYNFKNKKNKTYTISAIDSLGNIKNKVEFEKQIFGESFFEAPDQHWNRKFDNIYVLARKDKKAVITEIRLSKILR